MNLLRIPTKNYERPVGGSEKIWFFGPSGVGKKTLIYDLAHLRNPRNCHLSKKLNLQKREAILPLVLDNSISRAHKEIVESKHVQRYDIIKSIYYSDFKSKWMIHGQSIDLKDGFLPSIALEYRGILPKSKAVYLMVDEATYMARGGRHYENAAERYEQLYSKRKKTIAVLKKIFGTVILHQV